MLNIKANKSLYGSKGEMTLDINLQIEKGSFVALTGISGSGKTTLLRVLAGLDSADGIIKVNDKVWLDKKTDMAPQDREVGFMFQSYALFPHMTIEEQLLFVNQDKSLAVELMTKTGLLELKSRKPESLSGGQQQRVALCRALMRKPKLLLMDEPLSALDPQMRMRLQQEILELHRAFGTTTIMVSHEPSEIYRMADRVLVLNYGNIIADGSPRDILLRTTGSQKFSFEGEILELVMVDTISVAIVAIGQQIVEVVMGQKDSREYQAGDKVSVSTKAFLPTISKL